MPSSEFDPTTTFGSYLRFLRRRARLTQTELSIAVGYSSGQISMLENGQRVPDLTAISALFVAALGLEHDKPAKTQLVQLAQTTLAQHNQGKTERRTIVDNAPLSHERKTAFVVEHQVIWQQEELGVLEDVPPLPVYAVTRLGPLQRLQQWFNRERAVAICGLAGMGKSTLAATYAHEHEQRHPVLWLTFGPGLNGAPEAILRQLALFVAGYAAEPAHVAPLFRQPAAQEPRIPFHQMLLMVAAGLNELDTPLLVFDDAQQVSDDAQVLQPLHRLMTLAPNCRMLFVTREELSLPGLLHLTLAGLERAEALALVKNLSSLPLQPARLPEKSDNRVDELDNLIAQTAGSPMLLRLAVSQLEQVPLDTRKVGASLAAYLVEAILKNLEPAARQALGFLSLWRGVVDLTDPQLAELMSEELGAVYDHALAVTALQRRRLIDHMAHATPHRLLREPMLATLNTRPTQRRTLHHVAAKWAGLSGDLIEAAHHYCCAGDLQSACDVITNQAVAPYQLGRSIAAAAVVDEILGLARNRPPTADLREIVRQLLLLRGDLLVNTLRASEAHASYREAMEMTTQTLARAHIAQRLAVSLFQRGQAQAALELCEQALATLAVNITSDAIRLRLQLEGTRVKALLALARFDEARKICERALNLVKPLALAMPARADQVRAAAHLALGYMNRHQGRLAEAEQALLKAIKYARSGHLRDVEADALIYLSATQRDLGNFDGAESNAQQALVVAQAIENDYLASNILHFMTIISYYRDEQEQALARSERAMALKQPMGDSEGIVGCQIIQALVYTAQSRLDEARHRIEQALIDSERLENNWLHGFALYIAGIVLTFQSEGVAAEQSILKSLALEGFTKDQPSSAGTRIFLGIAYLIQGKLDLAQQVAEDTLPAAASIDVELLRGLLRGMLHLARGDQKAAQATAHQTVEQARATGYLIYAAEAENLVRVSHNPPPLAALPRAVCCR
jgi:tetratricopeptide (TPR) repeat protein/transcriptional regulator with XRE-family HTH domain